MTTAAPPEPAKNEKRLEWAKYVQVKKDKGGNSQANSMEILDTADGTPCSYIWNEKDMLLPEFLEFVLDSGTGKHMTGESKYFTKLMQLSQPICVHCPDGNILQATHSGKMSLHVVNRLNEERFFVLRDVLFLSLIHI